MRWSLIASKLTAFAAIRPNWYHFDDAANLTALAKIRIGYRAILRSEKIPSETVMLPRD
jgi:hypothetical protein